MTNFHPDYFPMAKWESELCQNSFSQTFIRNFEVKGPNYNLTNINLLRSLSWIDRNFMFSIKIRFCIKEFTSFFSVFCIELNCEQKQTAENLIVQTNCKMSPMERYIYVCYGWCRWHIPIRVQYPDIIFIPVCLLTITTQSITIQNIM